MEWKRFEELAAAYFREQGFAAKTTRIGADGGVDVELYLAGHPRPERRMFHGAYAYFRFVAAKPADSESLPEVISLTWRFEGEHPDDTLRASMDDLEDLLNPLCFAPWSRLVLVMTFRGVREWCFYANDYPLFTTELQAALASRPPFPIQIEHNYDPNWNYWQTFVDRRS